MPENPDNKIAGILKFSQDAGIKLETIGAFESLWEQNDFPKDYSIILGVNDSGTFITLQDCLETEHTSGTFDSCELRAHFVYVGIHLDKLADFKFDKVQVKYTYLFDWVNTTGIQWKFPPSDKSSYSIEYSLPEDIEFETSFGKFTIAFSTHNSAQVGVHSLREDVWLFLENFGQKNFGEISKQFLFPLQTLISLGTTKPNFIEKLFFFIEEYPDNRIEVHYQQPFYRTKLKERLFEMDMLFMLRDIFDKVQITFEQWQSLSQEIDNVLHLYFRLKRTSDTFLELKFLSMAQALESFNRQRRDERDKSFNRRMTQLFKETELVMNSVVPDKERFLELVLHSRDYYTHYLRKLKEKAATGSVLFRLTEQLSIMLDSCLLNEIGISQEDQLLLFTRNNYFNHICSQRTK